MPCLESSRIVRLTVSQSARQILPATATREVVFARVSSRHWQDELPKNYKRALTTNGSGTVARYSSSMAPAFRCRTHRKINRSIRSRRSKRRGLGFPLARIGVLLSLATGACHDLAIASYQGKGTGETNLFRRVYDSLQSGDVVLADALFDDYFIACELRTRNVDIVARTQYERVGSRTAEIRSDGEIIVWERPNKPRGMTGEKYRSYPTNLIMRQVTVDARDKNNRAQQFKVVTTILDQLIDGKQIGNLFERRWEGEVDIRSIKVTMQMDILRCKTPDMVRKEIWAHLLAYNLLRTVMAVAAHEHDTEPRKLSFKGAKQALTAFAPKIEVARPEDRGTLIDAMLTTIAYHRVGDRPGRWEPRARKRRPKPATRLTQPRHDAKLPHNQSKWF